MNFASTIRRKVRSAGRICARIGSAAQQGGLRGAARDCAAIVRAVVHERAMGDNLPGALATAQFDKEFNVDTTGLISMTSMTIDSPNYLYATVYKASDPGRFQEMIGRLAIPHSDYTFVDLGSGKGLTLLMASTLPFAAIRGVEFARELHEIAEANIRNYRNPGQKCHDVRSVHCDAAEFRFPDTALVIYFYHPFEREIMTSVVQRIEESYRGNPRPILIVYFQPALRDLLDAREFVRAFYERPIDHVDGKALAGYALYGTAEALATEVLRG